MVAFLNLLKKFCLEWISFVLKTSLAIWIWSLLGLWLGLIIILGLWFLYMYDSIYIYIHTELFCKEGILRNSLKGDSGTVVFLWIL